jgi:GntR family transcriptional regulator of vanillate catabolism
MGFLLFGTTLGVLCRQLRNAAPEVLHTGRAVQGWSGSENQRQICSLATLAAEGPIDSGQNCIQPQNNKWGEGPEMRAASESSSHTVSALMRLRELILNGDIKAGQRMSELALVERLGVSRTPIRAALIRLEQEGLLHALPTGGFVVHAFNERDIHTAIEIRGTLEGLAARLAAERGVSEAGLAGLKHCLARLDQLVLGDGVTVDNFSAYARLNEQFHSIVIDLADSAMLSRQIARAVTLPFASAGAFVMVQASLPEAHVMFTVAQDQHRCIVRAIEAREGERAEALMREHARLARRNLELALRNHDTRGLVPGSNLITFRSHSAA